MKKKKVVIISISIIAAVLLSAAIGTYSLLFSKPFKITDPTFIYIDEDDSADSVFAKIETNLHPESMTGIKILAKLKDYGENIYTGAYRINSEMTVLETFRMLKAGRQTPVKLIIPSVRTIDKLVSRVAKQIMADSASITSLINDSSYIAKLGYNKATIPALFIPNTYEVYWNMTAECRSLHTGINSGRRDRKQCRETSRGRTIYKQAETRNAPPGRPYSEIQSTGLRT